MERKTGFCRPSAAGIKVEHELIDSIEFPTVALS
jgi:hypothetical protein